MRTLDKAQDQFYWTMLDALDLKQDLLAVHTVPLHPVMTTLKMLGFDAYQVKLTFNITIVLKCFKI